jgi:protocatechuate 3,4-dioxygenase beta subunit
LLSLSLLVFGPAVSAQETKPVASGRGLIAGIVAEAGSNRPLADVMVTLESADGGILKTITDQTGRYRFEGIGPGGYRVTAALSGYAQEPERAQGMSFPLRPGEVRQLPEGYRVSGGVVWLGMTEEQTRNDLNIKLSRAGALAGRVLKADGQPVKDAAVSALLMTDDSSFRYNAQSQARTNERGEYRINDLLPGLYRVSTSWFDPERAKARAGQRSVLVFFPGTNAIDEAMSLRVEPGGAISNLDIRLPSDDVFTLSGHLLRGTSEGGIEAHLLSGPWKVRTVDVAEDGAFTVTHLEPGRHTLWARASTLDGSEGVWTTLEVGSDVVGLAMPLRPTGEIRGRVMTEEGTSLGDGYQVIAEFVDAQGEKLDAVPRDRGDIAADGTFHVAGLFGYRRLRLSGNEWDVTRVLVGKSPVDLLGFDAGERIDDVVVLVRSR